MPYDSFQEYLETLEKNDCVKWVEEEVDKDWEITSVARNYFRKTKESERCALVCTLVKTEIPSTITPARITRSPAFFNKSFNISAYLFQFITNI